MNNLEYIVAKAGKVADFIMDCIKENPERCPSPYPVDDFGYAKELLDWEASDKPSIGYYGTEDRLLLCFADELRAKFGLQVLTMKEAKEREEYISVRIARAFDFAILNENLPGETV